MTESAGMSIRAMASAMGVSPTTVLKDIQSLPDYQPDEDGGIVVRKVLGRDGKIRLSRRIDTTERDRLIRALRTEGKPLRKIAAQAGCSVGTVHRVLRSTAPQAICRGMSY